MFELQTFHKPTAGTINYREGHLKDNAKIRLEQNNDEVLRNLRAKIEGNPTTKQNSHKTTDTNIIYKTSRGLKSSKMS